jgi:hypothetical protein
VVYMSQALPRRRWPRRLDGLAAYVEQPRGGAG